MASYKLPFTGPEVEDRLNKVTDLEKNKANRSEIPSVPVQSVNGKTGDVKLSADDVGARPNTWIPSAADVRADTAGTASSAVTEHNTATDAHNDIRLWLSNVETWVKNLLDADDETLNQTSEMIQYMKDNRELIEQITTGKVSVTDIINNLTTNVSDKPLSAAQGVVLKGLIDALQTAVNAAAKATDLTSHTGNTTVHIKAAERTKWNQAVTDVGNLSEEIADQKKVYFKAVNGGIYVNAHYSEANDITFYLCKHGANSLFDFYSIGLVAKAVPTSKVTTPSKYIVQTSGDWHAPYVVKAVNNADGQMVASGYFTGGNHGYDNTATGVPTARCENLKMYADGKALATGNEGYCDKIRIEWDNFVQAYNTTKANGTGREVLREHITMLFDGYKWETETTIYPLEPIKIQTWYGLQFFTANYDYVAYINGETGLISSQSGSSESGNAKPNAMKFFNLEDTAIVEIDTCYDLGTRKHASGSTAGFFARGSYSKAYGTIIGGSTELVSGGAYSMRGSYIFKHEIQQTPIYESEEVGSLLKLNRTASNSSSSYLSENCETFYINPARYGSVDTTGTPCVVADLTENSITVTENGAGGSGCAFPFGLTAQTSADRYGKTFTLTWDATGTIDTRFRLMCLGNSNMKYGDIDNKSGTKSSCTIAISADGNTVTIDGTVVTSNGNPFTAIAFFFGAATSKTVAYKNVKLVEA